MSKWMFIDNAENERRFLDLTDDQDRLLKFLIEEECFYQEVKFKPLENEVLFEKI